MTECPDGLAFDPEPWVESTMAASAQRTWSRTRFVPREGYCQDAQHYDARRFGAEQEAGR